VAVCSCFICAETPLKARVVAGFDGASAVAHLREIVGSLKNTHINSAQLQHLSPAARVALMHDKKQFVHELETLLNSVQLEVLLRVAAMRADEQALWVRPVLDWRHGAAALRRAKLLPVRSVMRQLVERFSQPTASAVAASSAAVAMEQDPSRVSSALRSILSGQTSQEHAADIRTLLCLPTSAGTASLLTPRSVVELLYAYGAVGFGLRVHRSEAAAVNPWLLGVSYVSATAFDTSSVMCALDAGISLTDDLGETVQDVVCVFYGG
jgi:hypothetical protein